MVSKARNDPSDLYSVRYAASNTHTMYNRFYGCHGGGSDCSLYRRHLRIADTPPATDTLTAPAADYAAARATVTEVVSAGPAIAEAAPAALVPSAIPAAAPVHHTSAAAATAATTVVAAPTAASPASPASPAAATPAAAALAAAAVFALAAAATAAATSAPATSAAAAAAAAPAAAGNVVDATANATTPVSASAAAANTVPTSDGLDSADGPAAAALAVRPCGPAGRRRTDGLPDLLLLPSAGPCGPAGRRRESLDACHDVRPGHPQAARGPGHNPEHDADAAADAAGRRAWSGRARRARRNKRSLRGDDGVALSGRRRRLGERAATRGAVPRAAGAAAGYGFSV
jgi:hypothetical protein